MFPMSMSPRVLLAAMVLVIGAGLLVVDQREARAGEVGASSGYKVLEPIRHGNLTVFPVVAAKNYPIVIFDPHGDYTGLADVLALGRKVKLPQLLQLGR